MVMYSAKSGSSQTRPFFLPAVQLRISVRILLCKYGLPQKQADKLTIDRLLCLLVYVLVMLDYLINSPLDVMISAVRSFADITLIFNLIMIFLYGCGCPGVS